MYGDSDLSLRFLSRCNSWGSFVRFHCVDWDGIFRPPTGSVRKRPFSSSSSSTRQRMMAVFTGDETAEAAVAVAVCGGSGASRSRRAVRWAAEHLVPHAHRVVLVHVIRAVTSIPSPCVPPDPLFSSPSNPTAVIETWEILPVSAAGERVPVDRLGKDVVEMYVQDLKSKAQQVLFPYRELCGTRNVRSLLYLIPPSISPSKCSFRLEFDEISIKFGSFL